MSNLEIAKSAIELEDMELALKAVQKLQPEELHKIIQFALIFNSDVAKAVIALAESMLIIAKLEAKLEKVRKALAEEKPSISQEQAISSPPLAGKNYGSD
ncbi:MAG: hypothetical protein LBV56_07035 [Delftia acidovorans]|jgi:hypothetical protein|nr:hypothetical protein [Delftia acidovorans]